MAALIRLELLTPNGDLLAADTYNKVFSAHGIIMVFFFLVPVAPAVLGNFLIPLMIGARDVAFPKINLFSWYLFVTGGCIELSMMVFGGVDTGWTFTTPLSTHYLNTNVVAAAMGIFVAGFSSILTGLNFIVTIHRMRAPGMGDHCVRVLTMKEAITETRPLVLDALLKIPASFYVVTEWTPLTVAKARKEVNKRRRHFNMSKTGFVSQIGNDATKTNPRDVLVDESKQADIENLGDCLRALGDGQSLGDFSLTIVLYGLDKHALDQLVGEFTGVFTNADGNLFAETYNQLNAYFATVPGGYAMNLRRLYLLNSNYADLSFLFTILPGEKSNPHLSVEYLAVLETDNATPYFLNLHNGEVAHTLILGMTGSGKSYLCSFLLQNAQKYAPLTFIFDIGGSFESLTHIFGGSYLNVGQEARDFTINPFSLPPTKDNLQFLFSFFRVLIEGTEQRYRLDYKEERKLWDAVERTYMLEEDQRTFSNFSNIIGELKERLHRWTRGGQYRFRQ